jgi:hypothetical protein
MGLGMRKDPLVRLLSFRNKFNSILGGIKGMQIASLY